MQNIAASNIRTEIKVDANVKSLLPSELKVRDIKKIVAKILTCLFPQKSECNARGILSIFLTNDRKITELNVKFRGKSGPTDVLSFSANVTSLQSVVAFGCDNSFDVPLGDIVVSLETANKQAKDFGVELYAEIVRLFVHGVLHICNYEHESVAASVALRMREKESEILKILGITVAPVTDIPRVKQTR